MIMNQSQWVQAALEVARLAVMVVRWARQLAAVGLWAAARAYCWELEVEFPLG